MFMFPGCPAEEAKVPFDTKDINMSEYLLSNELRTLSDVSGCIERWKMHLRMIALPGY